MSKSQCQNCNQEFTIYPEDKKFYQRFEVPEPTWCPDCRRQRRLAFRNHLHYYSRRCDLCNKEIISPYPADVIFPVYCPECWWSDNWDRYANARNYDFSRGFFKQFADLLKLTPRLSAIRLNCHNCDYADKTANSKNCYLIIGNEGAEDCYYGEKFLKSKDCLDSNTLINSELCYYCLDSENLYNCNFCQYCSRCSECWLCYDCRGCQNCFGCWNLRNKKYYIFNQSYSEQEYKKKIRSFKLSEYSNLEKQKENFYQEKEKNAIHRFMAEVHTNNSTGDYLLHCDNCWQCFNDLGFKDSRYANDDEEARDMMDTANCGYGELCYEFQDGYGNHFCRFNNFMMLSSFIDYSISVHSSKNCFACTGLNKAEFCILNKKYSEIDYNSLREKIIEKMKADGEYGEYFPPPLSPFGYNETKAMIYWPMTKEEVLAKGWNWNESKDKLTNQKTADYQMPDSIEEVTDDILEQILKCVDCGKNYKIIKQELDFYKKKGLPIPHKCFRCRYQEIFSRRNPRKLWDRQCDQCGQAIKTTYAPDRSATVYCAKCYQKAIY